MLAVVCMGSAYTARPSGRYSERNCMPFITYPPILAACGYAGSAATRCNKAHTPAGLVWLNIHIALAPRGAYLGW